MKINEKKGITLIALVVTIIVLLLIAGVSISMLTGQNGILTRAAESKVKTEDAEKQENERMQEYEDITAQYVGDSEDGKKLRDENMFEFDTTTGTILRVKEDYLVDYYNGSSWDGSHSYTTESKYWCKIKENVDTLIIPKSIQGTPVNEIKCLGILNVKNIIIEEGIKKIEKIGHSTHEPDHSGFRDLELEKITIPDSVTSIGDKAFENCRKLTSINIPSSVTSIDSYAFYGCTNLTITLSKDSKLTIPSNKWGAKEVKKEQ